MGGRGLLGRAKKKKSPEITILCVGAGFLHSHFISGPACQPQQLINLPAQLSNPTDLGCWISTLRKELTHQAIKKQCLTDSDRVDFLPVVAKRPLKLKTPVLPTEQPRKLENVCLFLISGQKEKGGRGLG